MRKLLTLSHIIVAVSHYDSAPKLSALIEVINKPRSSRSKVAIVRSHPKAILIKVN